MSVDPSVLAIVPQLPQFVSSVNALFVKQMEGFRDYAPSLPPLAHLDSSPTATDLKHVVWFLTEGSLYPLQDLITSIRERIPSIYADSLSVSDEAVREIILSGCDRKPYGIKQSNSPGTPQLNRNDQPAWPSLLIWEIDMKLIPLDSPFFGQEFRRVADSSRKARKEISRKISILEKLILGLHQFNGNPSTASLAQILKSREQWRVEEKKDEKDRILLEERLRREQEKLEKDRRKAEEAAMKRLDAIVKPNKLKVTTLKSTPAPVALPVPTVDIQPAKSPAPKMTLLNFFSRKTSSTPEIETVRIAPEPEVSEVLTLVSACDDDDFIARWKRVRRSSYGKRKFYRVIEGVKLDIPTVDTGKARLPGWGDTGMSLETLWTDPIRTVYLCFHDRERPPVKALVQLPKASRAMQLGAGKIKEDFFEYTVDTDEEWEELNNAEDLLQDEEGSEEEEIDEADSFFVSDDRFSEGDNLSEDEQELLKTREKRPNSIRGLEPFVIHFEQSKENINTSNKWYERFISGSLNVQINVQDQYFCCIDAQTVASTKAKATIWDTQLRTEFAKFVHGKSMSLDDLIKEYECLNTQVKDSGIRRVFRELFRFEKRQERRAAWYVCDEAMKQLSLDETELSGLAIQRVEQKKAPRKSLTEDYPSVAKGLKMGNGAWSEII